MVEVQLRTQAAVPAAFSAGAAEGPDFFAMQDRCWDADRKELAMTVIAWTMLDLAAGINASTRSGRKAPR